MKTRLLSVLAVSAAASLCLSAALASEQQPPHESRMATCSHESKGLKGEERQNFMSKCLKGDDAHADHKSTDQSASTSHLTGQQSRMKTCNDEAGKKDLHGDERRKFMSACLKG